MARQQGCGRGRHRHEVDTKATGGRSDWARQRVARIGPQDAPLRVASGKTEEQAKWDTENLPEQPVVSELWEDGEA